jgi:hypothetical protein
MYITLMENEMSKPIVLLLILAIAGTTLACQFLTAASSSTPTPDLWAENTMTAQAKVLAQYTEQAAATLTANVKLLESTPTTAPPPVKTATVQPAEDTPTPKPVITQADLTNPKATTQAQPLYDLVQQFYNDGILTSKDGQFVALDDFNENEAKIDYYRWWKTGYSPDNFVLHANTSWSSAYDKANWPSSGCGFVFGENGKENHDLIYLGLDGYVYLARIRNSDWKTLAQKRYGKLDIPEGGAEITFVVNNKHVYYYVNGTKVLDMSESALQPGELALTLLSGTNKDYGTRCKMDNVGLWIVK